MRGKAPLNKGDGRLAGKRPTTDGHFRIVTLHFCPEKKSRAKSIDGIKAVLDHAIMDNTC